MPSAQHCAQRLREQAYRTLLPQIRDLEQELQSINASLSSGVHQIERKLEALSHIELPTTEVVLDEVLGDVTREYEARTGSLALFAQGLRGKETQEEILTSLLEFAQKYFPRTALFAVRGDQLVGWSSRGYSEDIAREISSSSFLRTDCSSFEQALEDGNPVTGIAIKDGPVQILKEESTPLCLVPLRVLQRPVAILLAGGAEPKQAEIDAVSVLAEFAILRLENIALKILYELTSTPGTHVPVQEAAAAAPDHEPGPMFAWAQASAEAPAAPLPESRLESQGVGEWPPTAEAVSSLAIEEALPAESIQAQEPAPIPEPEAEAQEIQPVPEEERLHSDAKRFARLLVAEIKLYNEHHVVEGRENGDLYLRLKRDIDRSREMYEKRVSPTVARKIDYFHDEIIRILGDNDPSTLGSDYPGPRVES